MILESEPLTPRERRTQSYLNRWMLGGCTMFAMLVASWAWFGWTLSRGGACA